MTAIGYCTPSILKMTEPVQSKILHESNFLEQHFETGIKWHQMIKSSFSNEIIPVDFHEL